LIYGLDNIDLSFPYIICFEGVYDSLFIPNAIAIGGKSLTKFQHEIISKRYPNHQIVLSFDNDDAGMTAMAKQIKQHPNEFQYFKWFDDTTKEKDINDYVLKMNNVNLFSNKEVVKKHIISAVGMKLFLLQKGIWKNA
jgi:DNA primase